MAIAVGLFKVAALAPPVQPTPSPVKSPQVPNTSSAAVCMLMYGALYSRTLFAAAVCNEQVAIGIHGDTARMKERGSSEAGQIIVDRTRIVFAEYQSASLPLMKPEAF